VLVPRGLRVTVDAVLDTPLQTLRVDGELRFEPTVDTQLRVDSMLVAPSGLLQMGTAEQPIQGDVTARLRITDAGEIDRVRDPFAIGRGLVVHGSATFHGEERTSHLPLATAPL
jgi:hypothetical protein